MQDVVFDDPYQFVPPYRGRFWSYAIGKFLPTLLRRKYGIVGWQSHGLEHLRASLQAGHGIILCPNHSRLSDPMISGIITTETPCHAHAMASWHVFRQGWLETFVARRVGAFSVYREGVDRRALDTAVNIVATAERPLIIFPEGVISGANDRLMPLMDGTSFVARAAARKRLRSHPDSKVVIHPVAYRYRHQSDPEVSLGPILEKLEQRFFWRPQQGSLLQRVHRLRDTMQCVREMQVLGTSRTGDTEQRIANLVDHILRTHEQEWLGRPRRGDPIARVKDLRIEILKDMVAGNVDDAERQRRWGHLADLYYAQCMSLHVPGYIDEQRAGTRLNHRLFETVYRMEEELTDVATVIEDLHVDVKVGAAIDVDPTAGRNRGGDPIMARLRTEMLALLQVEDEWPPQGVEDAE
ncbi:MAG: 1-acyl-sn-glycerol-3-phosphate acyltransferase [Fuerstiella sp.]